MSGEPRYKDGKAADFLFDKHPEEARKLFREYTPPESIYKTMGSLSMRENDASCGQTPPAEHRRKHSRSTNHSSVSSQISISSMSKLSSDAGSVESVLAYDKDDNKICLRMRIGKHSPSLIKHERGQNLQSRLKPFDQDVPISYEGRQYCSSELVTFDWWRPSDKSTYNAKAFLVRDLPEDFVSGDISPEDFLGGIFREAEHGEKMYFEEATPSSPSREKSITQWSQHTARPRDSRIHTELPTAAMTDHSANKRRSLSSSSTSTPRLPNTFGSPSSTSNYPSRAAYTSIPEQETSENDRIRPMLVWDSAERRFSLELTANGEAFYKSIENCTRKMRRNSVFERELYSVKFALEKGESDCPSHSLCLSIRHLEKDWEQTVEWIRRIDKDHTPPCLFAILERDDD